MNLKKVTIGNFKCFQAENEIELGKLTLLTGANSSGKSSIIYSILGAIQSGEFPFQFSTNGKYVNMGDFREVVHNHNRKEKIILGFEFEGDSQLKIETVWVEDEINKLPKLFELKAEDVFFNLSIKASEKDFTVDFDYNPFKDSLRDSLTRQILKSIGHLASNIELSQKQNLEILSSNLLADFNSQQIARNILIDKIPNFNGEKLISEKGLISLRHLFDIIPNQMIYFDEKINFISSSRLAPDRTYLEQTKTKLKVQNNGEGYLDQIISWESKNKEKLVELVSILKDLNLLFSIKSKRLDGGRFEIAVQTKEGGVETSLTDVGFGISQFLPILVADLQLPNSSTLFVAQPEIHLHPSVQSSFGDYLMNQIKTKDKNYVIETHSEYLLNKIRLGIVKGTIKEEDVKILFVDNEGVDNIIHKIEFTKQGQILNAPDNFFKTYMMDVMEIAINAATD